MADVIIDFGEDGTILVEPLNETVSLPQDSATEKTGFGDTLCQTGEKIKAGAAGLLKLPLTGLAKLFLASLPESSETEPYELDEFSIEFNLGIKTEAGSNAGAVAKVSPEGAFKCTYTWKRKEASTPTVPTPPIS